MKTYVCPYIQSGSTEWHFSTSEEVSLLVYMCSQISQSIFSIFPFVDIFPTIISNKPLKKLFVGYIDISQKEDPQPQMISKVPVDQLF